MNYLSLVLRNLSRNKRRTILTTLSITVSVFIFASLISLPGLLNKVLRQLAAPHLSQQGQPFLHAARVLPPPN